MDIVNIDKIINNVNTPQNSKYEYGILLVNGRYVAETPVEEGKSYAMYFAKTGVYSLRLQDSEKRDPLALKGWEYGAICERMHWHQTGGHSYILYIGKGVPEERFAMEVGDNLVSDFANFMMDILNKCETIDDVKQLYAEYVTDLESRYETIEGIIHTTPDFGQPHYNEEKGYTISVFDYSPCQMHRWMAWYGDSYKNERNKFKARGKWKRVEEYGWTFIAEEIEFMEM